MKLSTAAATLLGGLLLAACQSSELPQRSDDEVANLILHQEYEEAVRVAKERHDKDPGNEQAELRYRQASVAYLMEMGRRATFADRDEEALEFFEQALALDPEATTIDAWLAKTHTKLSERWLERALQLHAQGNLEGAVEAYEVALSHTPGHIAATRGMMEATLQINHRKGLAADYYNQGVRTLRDYWLERSLRSFAAVKKYQPDTSTQVDKRRGQVESFLAEERATVAAALENDGLYDAARNEYRLSLALDPDHAGARAGFDRMDREAKATEVLRDARMSVLRGDYAKARELVEEGRQMTELQEEAFQGVLTEIEEDRVEKLYQAALSLEKDYRYRAAIRAYTGLLAEVQYYKDALARKQTLEHYVERVPRYYAEAEAEEDLEVKLGLFRAARDLWPEYEDVEDRVAELEKQLAERDEQ